MKTSLLFLLVPFLACAGSLILTFDPVLDPLVTGYRIYINDCAVKEVPQDLTYQVKAVVEDLPEEEPITIYATSITCNSESDYSPETAVTIPKKPEPPGPIHVTIAGELEATFLINRNHVTLSGSTNLVDWKPLLRVDVEDERFLPTVFTFRFPDHIERSMYFRIDE